MTDAEQIRALLQARADALHARDAAAVAAFLADEIITYDLNPPLAHVGGPVQARASLDQWFATWLTPIGSEACDLQVAVSGDLAFAFGLIHLAGTKTDGEEIDLWFRSTVCLRRIGGAWRIVHEHNSTQFYMDGSYKAATDLKP
ncbi:nuclear transport factor 2 family protein [Phenylobacterium sp. LH3H17]|uniref:YybH family protein n=1 Tax=Phenylobacterium sp. LH3H17 TaxID=2903901 RepID=UPI0020C953A5|nr:nuclear transport factor 2 family protein [Phenylobacterium sp. LH3H17]UTP40665.1 nuclear transport factor 2 family protein [Phenylobacterium sp. LH3H17]